MLSKRKHSGSHLVIVVYSVRTILTIGFRFVQEIGDCAAITDVSTTKGKCKAVL